MHKYQMCSGQKWIIPSLLIDLLHDLITNKSDFVEMLFVVYLGFIVVFWHYVHNEAKKIEIKTGFSYSKNGLVSYEYAVETHT